MAGIDEVEQDIGFDEEETLTSDDVVTLETTEGQVLECVVLAVVELDGDSFAVLTEAGTDDEDLLVVRYEEDDAGDATFLPLEDDSVLGALQEVLVDLLPMAPTGNGVLNPGPAAEA